MNEPTMAEILALVDFDRDEGGRLFVSSVRGEVFGNVEGSIAGNVEGTVYGDVRELVLGTIAGVEWKFYE